jgi:hypothetical protein
MPIFGIMKKCLVLSFILTVIAVACKQPAAPPSVTAEDSSLIDVRDTLAAETLGDSLDVLTPDTVSYKESQLIGRWLQPVPGVDKTMQGFQLKKKGVITSVNTYSLVYDKWQLMRDTLLLWSHAEGMDAEDTAVIADTFLIRSLTDSSLVLFPVNAAEGYLEEYKRVHNR